MGIPLLPLTQPHTGIDRLTWEFGDGVSTAQGSKDG